MPVYFFSFFLWVAPSSSNITLNPEAASFWSSSISLSEISFSSTITSAFTGTGVDLLFKSIGNKILDSNYLEKFNKQSHSYKNNDNLDDEELNDNNIISSKPKKDHLYLNDLNPKKKNKKCC